MYNKIVWQKNPQFENRINIYTLKLYKILYNHVRLTEKQNCNSAISIEQLWIFVFQMIGNRTTLPWDLCLASRAACLLAAAIGHPDKLLWVFRFELTCPRPLQPGVGHFKIVSCIARTARTQTRASTIKLVYKTAKTLALQISLFTSNRLRLEYNVW